MECRSKDFTMCQSSFRTNEATLKSLAEVDAEWAKNYPLKREWLYCSTCMVVAGGVTDETIDLLKTMGAGDLKRAEWEGHCFKLSDTDSAKVFANDLATKREDIEGEELVTIKEDRAQTAESPGRDRFLAMPQEWQEIAEQLIAQADDPEEMRRFLEMPIEEQDAAMGQLREQYKRLVDNPSAFLAKQHEELLERKAKLEARKAELEAEMASSQQAENETISPAPVGSRVRRTGPATAEEKAASKRATILKEAAICRGRRDMGRLSTLRLQLREVYDDKPWMISFAPLFKPGTPYSEMSPWITNFEFDPRLPLSAIESCSVKQLGRRIKSTQRRLHGAVATFRQESAEALSTAFVPVGESNNYGIYLLYRRSAELFDEAVDQAAIMVLKTTVDIEEFIHTHISIGDRQNKWRRRCDPSFLH